MPTAYHRRSRVSFSPLLPHYFSRPAKKFVLDLLLGVLVCQCLIITKIAGGVAANQGEFRAAYKRLQRNIQIYSLKMMVVNAQKYNGTRISNRRLREISTYRSSADDSQRGFQAGADLVFPKPMCRAHLLKFVASGSGRLEESKHVAPPARHLVAVIDDEFLVLIAWDMELKGDVDRT